MRSFFKILNLLILSTWLTACVEDFKIGDKFLEKAPGVDVTADTIFSKAEYAKNFLWNCYSGLYYGLPLDWSTIGAKMNMCSFEVLSDCWHSHMNWDGVNRFYYTGIYNASLEQTNAHVRFQYNGEGCWETIRKCWLFIEQVDKVEDMDSDEKERLKAEAKVIIATQYFDLYRHFGGLPLLEHSLKVGEEMTYPRATIEDTNNFMIKLLDEASGYLPWVLPQEEYQNWDGRFTRAAALGLKCKILLFTASPLFNDNEPYCTEPPQEAVNNHHVWTGEYKQQLWVDCLNACEKFFEEVEQKGFYSLNYNGSDYRQRYRNAYSQRGSGYDNPEALIFTRCKNYNNLQYFRNGSVPGGAYTPTHEFAVMFPMADGKPFDFNKSVTEKNMFFKDNDPSQPSRDPRLYENILVADAAYKGHAAEMWVGGLEMKDNSVTESGEFATGYGCYKYILDYQSSNGKPVQWPYLRMAELHLIYAEALMMNDRFDEAIAQIDKVRARVGLKGLKECNPNLDLNDKDILLKEILRERVCELGLEDVRLFDMIRHKLKDNFTTPLHGLRIKRADGIEDTWNDKPAASRGDRPNEFTYEIFELRNASRIWWETFSTKWYLSAFPTDELNKDYGLTQNPGW